MNINFGPSVRRALAAALDEAHGLRHDFVGPEHILLGLAADGDAETSALLKRYATTPAHVREQLLGALRPGRVKRRAWRLGDSAALPYTSRAKRVLEFALEAAHDERVTEITPTHLVAALLREEKSMAAAVLRQLGLDGPPAPEAAGGGDEGMPVEITIDDASDLSIYEQVVAQIREGVATGKLAAGDRLPPVRRLADQLDIAPGTVARAYSELERLGVVVTQGARGTRVAERQPPRRAQEGPDTLVGLLRPVAVAAFHLGATAAELRAGLDAAMQGIFDDGERPAA